MASTRSVDGSDVAYSVRKKKLNAEQVADTATDIAAQSKPLIGFHVTGPCLGCTHQTSDVFPAATIVMDSGEVPPEDSGRRQEVTIQREAIRSHVVARPGKYEIGICERLNDPSKILPAAIAARS